MLWQASVLLHLCCCCSPQRPLVPPSCLAAAAIGTALQAARPWTCKPPTRPGARPSTSRSPICVSAAASRPPRGPAWASAPQSVPHSRGTDAPHVPPHQPLISSLFQSHPADAAYRPSYPDELFDLVLTFAGSAGDPGRRRVALDVATGKAAMQCRRAVPPCMRPAKSLLLLSPNDWRSNKVEMKETNKASPACRHGPDRRRAVAALRPSRGLRRLARAPGAGAAAAQRRIPVRPRGAPASGHGQR